MENKVVFRNKSDLKFEDISSEEWRKYEFENYWFTIEKPLQLNVSASGGHRVFDAEGICHYIPAGWKHLSWKAKDGEPHFVL